MCVYVLSKHSMLYKCTQISIIDASHAQHIPWNIQSVVTVAVLAVWIIIVVVVVVTVIVALFLVVKVMV